MDARIDERALDEHLAALEASRSWSPRTISRLETLVRTGDEDLVFRVNPVKFAAERGMTEPETIDLFLHATAVGLFAMDWLLLCPMCSCVVGSFGSLRAVDNHYHCSMCQTDYEARRCQSKIEYSARTPDSNFTTIDFPRFFRPDPGGSTAISGIQNFACLMIRRAIAAKMGRRRRLASSPAAGGDGSEICRPLGAESKCDRPSLFLVA